MRVSGVSAERRLKVLVVDDSATVRQALSGILTATGEFTVATASDPLIALAKIQRERPDVILTDLLMPRMDGLAFLRQVMAADPIPVIVCSAVAERGTEAALLALEQGAVGIVTKPRLAVKEFLEESAIVFTDAIRGAAGARLRPRPDPLRPAGRLTADAVLAAPKVRRAACSSDRVVAIGASTGGTEALRGLLESLPEQCPPIAIVQHMPEGFTRAFADRLNRSCRIEVREAQDGDPLREGLALIAPGNRHLLVRRSGSQYVAAVKDGPLVSRHRPSVDVLLRSVADAAGGNAVGVILTGMGDDGAQGLSEMKEAGAATIAQDEATCVVFGMPREAIRRGAAKEVLPLPAIPGRLLQLAGERG